MMQGLHALALALVAVTTAASESLSPLVVLVDAAGLLEGAVEAEPRLCASRDRWIAVEAVVAFDAHTVLHVPRNHVLHGVEAACLSAARGRGLPNTWEGGQELRIQSWRSASLDLRRRISAAHTSTLYLKSTSSGQNATAVLIRAASRRVCGCAISESDPHLPRCGSCALADSADEVGSTPLLLRSESRGMQSEDRSGTGGGAAAVTMPTGILYEVWHGPAFTALANVTAQGGAPLSVEDVLRSNGAQQLSDVWDKYGVRGLASGFFFQEFPQAGAYCIYRRRPGEMGLIPDCPNIGSTLERHARQLVAMGASFVAVDCTNLGAPSSFADLIQMRPMEVLFEEWARLRVQGVPTPAIVAWQLASAGSTLWQDHLALYNNASYGDLVYRDPGSGKKMFLVPDNPTLKPDPGVLQQIASNGGRNDVLVAEMWFPTDKESASGILPFMSTCREASGVHTTSVVGRGLAPCNQEPTLGSPLGATAYSVSPSYQVGYSSLPFNAAGKFGAMTLKRQFATALAQPPAFLFLSSWNEWLAQPQPNPFPQQGAYAFSMGLPRDAERASLWVDTYGSSISRDLEPSAHFGALLYNTTLSCTRMLRAASVLGAPSGLTPEGSPTLCAHWSLVDEDCCSLEPTEAFHSVWVLQTKDGSDWLLTNSSYERQTLLQSGGWSEVCSPFGGPTDFCVSTALEGSPLGLRGPFVMASVPTPDTPVPLFRCRLQGSTMRHLFTTSPTCEQQVMEGVLGYLSNVRTSGTPRLLIRCRKPSTATYYHTLDGSCDPGDIQEASYGFVH